MVTTDNDRRFQLAAGDHLIEAQTGLHPFSVAQPADARRQSLELNLLARHFNPAKQVLIVREEFGDGFVCAVYILRIAGESNPPERTFAKAEEGPNVSWDKAREVESIPHSMVERALAQVVAIIENLRTTTLEGKHGLDVASHGCHR